MEKLSRSYIEVKGASEHNLKNIDVNIPKDSFVVITGVSGSGKSSLAFDTIYAEGQRRYVESLSSYARQFIGQLEKPKYETIKGLSPTIAIEQKSTSKNPRSTVGTITEIYDFLRVLFARIGIQHCHVCGKVVGRGDPEGMVQQILTDFKGHKLLIMAPLVQSRKGEHKDVLAQVKSLGYSRVRVDGIVTNLEDVQSLEKNKKHSIDIVIDRLEIPKNAETKELVRRLTDSVESAVGAGKEKLIVHSINDKRDTEMSTEASCCGHAFKKLDPPLFSFNSPLGMCTGCQGIGSILSVDERKLVLDENLSIEEGALLPWKNSFEGGKLKEKSWSAGRIRAMQKQWGLKIDVPWKKLPVKLKRIIMDGASEKDGKLQFRWKGSSGSGTWEVNEDGLKNRIMRHYQQSTSEQLKAKYLTYMSNLPCTVCHGTRLKPEIQAVILHKHSIVSVSRMTIDEAFTFFDRLKLSGNEEKIAKELVKEIRARLFFLKNVGLSYLSLDRQGPSLSGGEAQRIRLASQIGSELTGVLYVLDEPSIGLHQKDNQRLLSTLDHLKKIGNTVIVVEHDRETIEFADWVIDMGPRAGHLGGQIVSQGTPKEIKDDPKSVTGKYLRDEELICQKGPRRPITDPKHPWLTVHEANENNLKNLTVKLPLNRLVCITGVSGAGKSTFVHQILYPYLANKLHNAQQAVGKVKSITGTEHLDKVICVTQQPIGKTPRSNPATYTKVFDLIRDFFALLPDSKLLGYAKGRFSFNVKGGRCEACTGDGYIKVEMHFLADVFVPCETCKGKRFNSQTLEVKYKGKSIADVLDMSVAEARELFQNHRKIVQILDTLIEVGLDYIKLGQSATTLSGGEAQRIKLAKELAKTDTGKSIYFLDEPTTGLHFDDIKKLVDVLQKLVDRNNTIVLIEHNTDVIQAVDWIVDLGPEGGQGGGVLVAEGAPDKLKVYKHSYTQDYL